MNFKSVLSDAFICVYMCLNARTLNVESGLFIMFSTNLRNVKHFPASVDIFAIH